MAASVSTLQANAPLKQPVHVTAHMLRVAELARARHWPVNLFKAAPAAALLPTRTINFEAYGTVG